MHLTRSETVKGSLPQSRLASRLVEARPSRSGAIWTCTLLDARLGRNGDRIMLCGDHILPWLRKEMYLFSDFLGWNVARGSCKGVGHCGGAHGMLVLAEHWALCPIRRPVRAIAAQERWCGLELRGGRERGGNCGESGCTSKVDPVRFMAVRDDSSVSPPSHHFISYAEYDSLEPGSCFLSFFHRAYKIDAEYILVEYQNNLVT